jgi:SlyX protein
VLARGQRNRDDEQTKTREEAHGYLAHSEIGDGARNAHSAAMTDAERLTHLEERYAHLQRHVAEQDKAMLELAEEFARVKAEVAALRTQNAGGSSPIAGNDEPADERPPHY